MRILVVASERKLARTLVAGLKSEQFAVDTAPDAAEALRLAGKRRYTVIVLDLSLDGGEALSIIKRLRSQRLQAPILILPERSAVQDTVNALQAGADDYLLKPVSFQQLLTHVRIIARRSSLLPETCRVCNLEIDPVRRQCTRGGKSIPLTPKEYALLEYLMRNAGRALTRTMIVENVWQRGFEGLTNIVDVYVSHLRAKVDRDFRQKLIHTVRGIGYILEDDNSQGQAA